MLAALTIQNVVLIDHLVIQFDSGLCALTGETGAGKSILLDSLGLALGARSDSGLVRKGADFANVSAEFNISKNHPVFHFLKEQGLDIQSPVILRRSVGVDGKSRAFVNDHPISASLLKQIGDMMVEIHGQFDTQILLNPRLHRGLVDEYAGVQNDIKSLQKTWSDWRGAMQELKAKKEEMDRVKAEEIYLRAALEQLDEISPKEDEEEGLTNLRSQLMRRDQTIDNLKTAKKGTEEALNQLNTVWRAIEKAGEGKSDTALGVDRAMVELQEVLMGVQSMAAALDDAQYSLPEIDDRLFALKAQARKHACSIDDLPKKRDELFNLLRSIEHGSDNLIELEKKVKIQKENYIKQAHDLSSKRKSAAQALDKLVAKELIPLKLDKARFETVFEQLSENEWGGDGIDKVQFMVATNPGSAAGPLNKIASGGEMARFMLALKVVLVEVGSAQTLVFDEVDSGIGGATADAVGERLSRLSKKRQILVVTHSPQVAAKSSYHAIVVKTGKTNPTTKILALSNENERCEEIARMLSGAEITKEARAQAAKLLEKSAA